MPKFFFPSDFLWGAATSAHQVEGHNYNSDWWLFEQIRGRIKNNDTSEKACDHYRLYAQDFALAKQLNHNSHRLSIEWARIEPKENIFSEEETKHYINVLKNLKEQGMTTFLTLHHFTNPIWFSQLGGFLHPEASFFFNRYVNYLIPKLKNYVDFWITINEPMVYASASYLSGMWPPQKKSFWQTRKVLNNLVKSHRMIYRTIHSQIPNAKVGIAKNNLDLEPANENSIGDKLIAKIGKYFWNEKFLNKIKKYQDFIGLNYYFHDKVCFNFGKLLKAFRERDGFKAFNIDEHLPRTDLSWKIYPRGIYNLLLDLKKYQKPIYITENGLADAQDKYRAKFIIDHLRYVHQAIKEGIDVRGYLHWSLLDNLEWHEGYKPRFGLIKVDYQTQQRTIRKSAEVYAKICQDNCLEI